MSDVAPGPAGVGEPLAAGPIQAAVDLPVGAPAPEAPPPRPKPKIGDTRPAPVVRSRPVGNGNGSESDAPAKPRRRRRGGRGRGGRSPSGQKPTVEATEAPVRPATPRSRPARRPAAETELAERPGRRRAGRRRGRERKGRPVGRYLMCVHVGHEATQIAVLEGRSLIEHHVARATDDANQIDGNIYRGRVKNVLPGHGGGLRRHRHAEERRLVLGRRPDRAGRRDRARPRRPTASSTCCARARRSSAR